MKTISLSISLLLLFSFVGNAQRFRAKNIQKALDTATVLENSFSGFILVDPAQGQVLFEQYADKYMTPASNTKLYTFYAAQKMLGESLPAMNYYISGDSLIFWGTGYPLFLNPDFADNTVDRFFDTHRDKNFFYREVPMKEQRFGPGWAWSDFEYYYSTEKSAFPIYGNHIRVKTKGNEDSLKIHPDFFGKFFKKTYRAPEGQWRALAREESANAFTYFPTVDTLPRERIDYVPFRYSSGLFVELLEDKLKKQIDFYEGPLPSPAQVLYSTQTDTLYRKMLQESDNFLAEQILMMCASTLRDTLDVDSTINYVLQNFMDDFPIEPNWADGSGLSRYNMFTPSTTAKLLEKMRREVGMEKMKGLLPAGGVSGTIESWYANTDTNKPYVFAKTGTLSNNHCLSGYLITNSGKTLVFSFMHNHYVAYSSQIKRQMQKILEYIRDTY